MATKLNALPRNIDAEVALLGCIFKNPGILPKLRALLEPTDFFKNANSEIYRAFLSVKDPDVITVSEYLDKKNALQKAGGTEYLAAILETAITSHGYQAYADIVKELSVKRNIILQCSALVEKAYDGVGIADLVCGLKAVVRDIQSKGKPDITDTTSLLMGLFKDIEQRKQSQNYQVGIPTGIPSIDAQIGGLEKKSLTYLIGRPSMGKTALALAMAENIAQSGIGLVLFFSLEMGDVQLMRRRLSAKSNVFLSRIRTGNVEDSQWPDLVKAADGLSLADMLIVDKPKYKTIEHLVDLAESISIDRKISCVFVDHVQLMRSQQKFNNRHLEISCVSNSLKDLAKNLDIPVVGLSQLSREVEKRNNKRPVLSDLKESGDLEQDADIVIGIYRKDRESEAMELGGLKGRDIGTWQTTVEFNRFTQRIF